jgi:ATP-dependent DNA helicase DinG
VIEVDVHQQLREFLREQGEAAWPHHLTIARLVARAVRLHRPALLQVGSAAAYQGRYRLSYLVPSLLTTAPMVIVAPNEIRQRLLRVELPRLCEWLNTPKPIQMGERWPHPGFNGILLTDPTHWLADYLEQRGDFPAGITTIIDQAEDLLDWVRQQLTICLDAADWADLMLAYPNQAEAIRNVRVQLTRLVFQHAPNPYDCNLLDQPEQDILFYLRQRLALQGLANSPTKWQRFWQQLPQTPTTASSPNQLRWVDIQRVQGQFSLNLAPIVVNEVLQPLWERQPVVLLGGSFDLDPNAPQFRQQIGLSEATCLKFLPDRQTEAILLYLPKQMPMPNTPTFPAALLQQIHLLLQVQALPHKLLVLIVEDMPLRAQVGATLTAEFGSRVRVETTDLDENSILVTGWQFWRQQHSLLPQPHCLGIATLPIPSLEDPQVAGQVAYYKHLRQDWFRQYLLPVALNQLEHAVAPVRAQGGLVAIWDPRVIYRNYGQQILSVLSPYLRSNYLDPSLFTTTEAASRDCSYRDSDGL